MKNSNNAELFKAAFVLGCNKTNVAKFDVVAGQTVARVKNRQSATTVEGTDYLIITPESLEFVNGKKWSDLTMGMLCSWYQNNS